MADYDINLPMYLVIRIHEAYPESQNVISEKNSTDIGRFLYEGALKDPDSKTKSRLYGEWRDISCPNYKSFLHDVGIERDQISEHILPTI